MLREEEGQSQQQKMLIEARERLCRQEGSLSQTCMNVGANARETTLSVTMIDRRSKSDRSEYAERKKVQQPNLLLQEERRKNKEEKKDRKQGERRN